MPIQGLPEDESIRTLYVGGIYDARVSEQDLRDHFQAYGELESIVMVRHRACAYVTFSTRKSADKTAKELSDSVEIKGLMLKLMWGAAMPQLGRAFCASTDPQRTGAVIPSQQGGAVSRPRENTSGTSVLEGVSGDLLNASASGKRSSNPREEMSPQEMRERVMKRKAGSSTSTSTSTPVGSTITPPVSQPGLAATQVGSATVGATAEETPLTRFVTSFPRDFLLEKSGVTKLWPDADTLLFPGPMKLLENKSHLELVNQITEMNLQAVQAALMSRRLLLDELGQQEVWRARLAEAEAAEARMSSQLREAAAIVQSLKEVAAAAEARVAAAEARAAAAVEARMAREALLITADAQLREMVQKMKRKDEEILEERKDAASSAALRARAKLMREFLDGKSSSWDPQAEIEFYVTHIGEEADLVSKDTPNEHH